MNQKNSEAILSEADARLKDAYKVKSVVCEQLAAGNPFAAAIELNLFFSAMFNPRLFAMNSDKEELVKQANKLFAKTELYTWKPFHTNVFPGLGVALNYSKETMTPMNEGYRTLFLLLKNAASIPAYMVDRFKLTQEVCDLYTESIRKELKNEFGDQIASVFNTDGTIFDRKIYQQVIDFVTKHTPVLFKDEIEQKQFPAVLVEIALKGMKAFAFPPR